MIFQSALGQTGNHLVDFMGLHFTFDENNELVVDFAEEADRVIQNVGSMPLTINNYSGDLLAYENSVGYHPYNDSTLLHQYKAWSTAVIPVSADEYLCFFNLWVNPNERFAQPKSKVYSRKMVMTNGKLLFTNEPAKLFIDRHTHHILTVPDTMEGHWLITYHNLLDYTAYYYKGSDVPLREVHSRLPADPLCDPVASGYIKSSPSGNYIMTYTNLNKSVVTDSFGYRTHRLSLLSFDKHTGKIAPHNTIYEQVDTTWRDPWADNNRTAQRGSLGREFEMSANERYCYFGNRISRGDGEMRNELAQVDIRTGDVTIMRSVLENNPNDTLEDGAKVSRSSYRGIKLLNNRRIYLKESTSILSDNSRRVSLDYIDQPNSKEARFVLKRILSPITRLATASTPFAVVPYNYLILRPEKSGGTCGTTVRFQDLCDYSLPNTTLQIYTEEVAGSGQLVARGSDPTVTFTSSGNYLCKVVLKSHEGTYKEVWYDTLKIRMPPVADFEAEDTIACAHAPLAFWDRSKADIVHPTEGEMWVWTFGDGETQTVRRPAGSPRLPLTVLHTYEQPGRYTVSLFYSNGFCDSTLVKNRYITVVDAPAPGFSIDDTSGCTPVTLTITDTITINTTKKEYNYNDGRGWVGVPVDQENFSQTYTTAGTYWIVQRLYGYTNCVTQQDSIQVFLSPGFTEDNKTNVALVSYQDVPAEPRTDEVVTVMWHTNIDTASSYEVYRNGKLIKELAAFAGVYNSADDSLVLERAGLNYAVVALDSCDTRTQAGRIGNPIQVTGKVIGDNDMSIISHTGYEELLLGTREISYSLQTFEYNEWVELNSQNNTLDYEDPRFLNFVNEGLQLEKSYRVVGSTNISSDKTISNILRLPYKPILFLPTAFTPNADGLNDVWLPITFGVEHYEVDIYNRYGQKIVHFTEQDAGWSAEDVAMGGYMVIIRAKGTDNEWYNLKSTVTVVR
jgi:gliding motility-associated-like protein